jgi:beta-glucosidase
MPAGHPRETVETVLDGFRAVAPQDWTVTHARSADIGSVAPDPHGRVLPEGQPLPTLFTPSAPDPALIAEPFQAARAAAVVVAVVGDFPPLIGEWCSTATLELQGGQVALLDALSALDTPLIVVLVNSKSAVLPASALNAEALIQAFNPGMRGGGDRRAGPRADRADRSPAPLRPPHAGAAVRVR